MCYNKTIKKEVVNMKYIINKKLQLNKKISSIAHSGGVFFLKK